MKSAPPDLLADPFREFSPVIAREPMQLLGAQFHFRSNSRGLLRLADSAFAGLPGHRFPAGAQRLRVDLMLTPGNGPRKSTAPPPLSMFSADGLLCGATAVSNFVAVSPQQRRALVAVSPGMTRWPYHTRFELIEFAVFTLAARAQGLVPLHAACVGANGRGILLMGPSGSGKSTVALHCLLSGFDFLSEDSVFVSPRAMLATGLANFLHVRRDSLAWLGRSREASLIRRSPVIRRRSGVEKFEVDLRQDGFRLAATPLKIVGVAFLTPRHARSRALIVPLSKSELRTRMVGEQAYGASQPQWRTFDKKLPTLDAFELRRGGHPRDAVEALAALL